MTAHVGRGAGRSCRRQVVRPRPYDWERDEREVLRPPSPWVTSMCVGASLGAAAGCGGMAYALGLHGEWPWMVLFGFLATVLIAGAGLLVRWEHADRHRRAAARRAGAAVVVIAAVIAGAVALDQADRRAPAPVRFHQVETPG